MPNWSTNNLKMFGEEQEIQKVKEHISSVDKNGEKNLIDLNKIAPIPPEYENNNSYEWCCNNWATKWNTIDSREDTDGSISFRTAWCPPHLAIEQLSKLYPNLKFRIRYCDSTEFMGYENFLAFENGEMTAYIKDINIYVRDEDDEINNLIDWYNMFFKKTPNPNRSLLPEWLRNDIRQYMDHIRMYDELPDFMCYCLVADFGGSNQVYKISPTL